MVKQKITSIFFLTIALILAARIPFSSASYPTLVTRNQWEASRQTKLIGWILDESAQGISSPSPSTQPAPPFSNNGIRGGYWPSWLAYSFPPSSIPTSYFTHVFYAYLNIDASTYNLTTTSTDDEWIGNFTATLQAKNPPAKSLLSIGGANSSPDTFSAMVRDPNNRAAFINSSIATARNYGFDGLNIDWEFPSNQDDMSNLSLLFQEWRQASESEAKDSGNPRLLITAAVYFASGFLYNQNTTYPGEAIAEYVDFVNPMCFNYHGSWDTSFTGEHAVLFDNTSNSHLSTSYGISSWIDNGVPPEKLVMGMPLYGRSWKLKDPKQHGIGAAAVGVGPGTNGTIYYKDIVNFNAAHKAHAVYDPNTVSEYSYSGRDWIGYDGLTSVKKKVQWAKANLLGGYFFWTLGYDFNWTLSATASNAWEGRDL